MLSEKDPLGESNKIVTKAMAETLSGISGESADYYTKVEDRYGEGIFRVVVSYEKWSAITSKAGAPILEREITQALRDHLIGHMKTTLGIAKEDNILALAPDTLKSNKELYQYCHNPNSDVTQLRLAQILLELGFVKKIQEKIRARKGYLGFRVAMSDDDWDGLMSLLKGNPAVKEEYDNLSHVALNVTQLKDLDHQLPESPTLVDAIKALEKHNIKIIHTSVFPAIADGKYHFLLSSDVLGRLEENVGRFSRRAPVAVLKSDIQTLSIVESKKEEEQKSQAAESVTPSAVAPMPPSEASQIQLKVFSFNGKSLQRLSGKADFSFEEISELLTAKKVQTFSTSGYPNKTDDKPICYRVLIRPEDETILNGFDCYSCEFAETIEVPIQSIKAAPTAPLKPLEVRISLDDVSKCLEKNPQAVYTGQPLGRKFQAYLATKKLTPRLMEEKDNHIVIVFSDAKDIQTFQSIFPMAPKPMSLEGVAQPPSSLPAMSEEKQKTEVDKTAQFVVSREVMDAFCQQTKQKDFSMALKSSVEVEPLKVEERADSHFNVTIKQKDVSKFRAANGEDISICCMFAVNKLKDKTKVNEGQAVTHGFNPDIIMDDTNGKIVLNSPLKYPNLLNFLESQVFEGVDVLFSIELDSAIRSDKAFVYEKLVAAKPPQSQSKVVTDALLNAKAGMVAKIGQDGKNQAGAIGAKGEQEPVMAPASAFALNRK